MHSILLRAGIPIVEHLRHLDRLPDSDFRFHAVPVKVRGFSAFPVRAYAVIKEQAVLRTPCAGVTAN